ncbi:MAG: lytic transglycosylase domain-containing protein [Pseudooceanicola sp.]|nr:lytic transglycosylase domain-containing protein [Pseudooceanicola sp.]MDF1856218.1 lytic transglycosylase domain-containing protein [Pseudooceanicola sp.]
MTAVTAPAQAEVQTGFGDFTNKRVKPPRADAKRRITVQIKPGDALKPPKPRAKPKTEADTDKASVAVGAAPGQLAWFWEAISPDLTASGPGRLEPALRRIAAPPSGAGVPAPRLGTLMQIARAHQADILLTTAGTNVSPALVLAVIAVESAGRVDAVSGAGAAGLMQLMPATAERFGVADRSNAADNIKGGVAFLDMLMTRFGGDPILVLAGYNAGENSIKTHSGVPPYAETRDYVPKVLAAFEVARNLCRTRPQLISDGCVFSFPS